MTQEEKRLLLKDLCARLPYGLKVMKANTNRRTVSGVDAVNGVVHFENDTISPFGLHIEHPLTFRQQVKPYLRPMSSMTEEEVEQYNELCCCNTPYPGIVEEAVASFIDWLNSHHFDYRDLIDKGLALPATEDMYKH